MSSNAAKPIRVFISYPHSNFKVLKELRENLGWLENSGQLEVFDDREILGGDDWNACIKTNLERAEIIIFIVTASFMCSPYCTNIELRSALEQRAKERTRIVPIIAETCDWEAMPIFQIAALPKDEANNLKPLNRWGRGRDVAFTQITQQIRQATEELFRLRASDESRDEIGNESTTALTDAFLPPVQHLERRALERGECFPQITDSVMYLWGVEQNYQEDVLSYLRRGRAIPSRLLYQSFRGTKNWLDLCDDDTYYPFYNSRLNIEENMEKIINALKGKGEDYLSQMPDIISLGPGNGIKDRIILTGVSSPVDFEDC